MEAGAPVRARWRVTTGDSVQTQPALADGVVYVTGTDGTLYALSADTGQPFWRFYLGPTFPSAPTVAGGTVYVGTADGRLHAIDAQQGLERWQFATAGPVFGAPAVDGAGVYVGTGEGFLHRVDAQTGSEVWRYEAGGMIEAAPRVQEGRVYVGSWNRTLHCVDAAQGKAVWTAPIGQNRYYSPAAATPLIHEGRVFVTSPDRNLYTLDAATGILLNRQDVKAYASLGQSADRLLIRALDGYLYAYQFDGVLCWKANLGWGWDTVPLPPVAVEGTLFVGSKQGSVFSLTSDGQLLWQYRLSDGLLLAPPAATTGLVVAGTMDGVITALEF
jgi:outer membrane protein assembly factor BamB